MTTASISMGGNIEIQEGERPDCFVNFGKRGQVSWPAPCSLNCLTAMKNNVASMANTQANRFLSECERLAIDCLASVKFPSTPISKASFQVAKLQMSAFKTVRLGSCSCRLSKTGLQTLKGCLGQDLVCLPSFHAAAIWRACFLAQIKGARRGSVKQNLRRGRGRPAGYNPRNSPCGPCRL